MKELDVKGFIEGVCLNAYEYFGAHAEGKGVSFRTYAPGAEGVNIFGSFNGWTETPMQRDEQGCYSIHIDNAKAGDLYKYVVYGRNGWRAEHNDPYGFYTELRPAAASIVVGKSTYKFSDEEWIKNRTDMTEKPMSVYEVHLGAFIRNPKNENGWYSYKEIAKPLIDHVKKSGYTHIELMPLCEYPFDGSWGYQLTGYFAATSRYGKPDELKYLINECHKAGIGVIMDFVPVHFAVDDYSLKLYDTTPLYEQNTGSNWGSLMFDHAKGEVCSFLLSSAEYWIKEFHFDGLRVDAVSNLIYNGGEQSRGENAAGMRFARNLTTLIKKKHPSVMLFAEDSSSWQGGVTKSVEEGGLGFDYKWDMGWMYDSLYFLSLTPEERKKNYHKLTFSMWYYYTERFILSLSHDEVVGGRGTLLEKMHGSDADKFAQLRAYYIYMYMHPGKKLNFMGNELAERQEWNETKELEFSLLDKAEHKGIYELVCELQKLYNKNEALFANEYDRENYEWLYCDDKAEPVYVMKRIGKKKSFVAVINFSDKDIRDFELKLDKEEEEKKDGEDAEKKTQKKSVKKEESWKLILCSEDKAFGGSGMAEDTGLKSSKRIMNMDIPAYSGSIYEVR
ncbi:MAG: 1,4-alpha-glucan branching protein GlgB [Lachnospiraceae bacterium]|nr:1,4-alpha-glucan branching protein GlgB [Lachnospiraceae bacterium]